METTKDWVKGKSFHQFEEEDYSGQDYTFVGDGTLFKQQDGQKLQGSWSCKGDNVTITMPDETITWTHVESQLVKQGTNTKLKVKAH